MKGSWRLLALIPALSIVIQSCAVSGPTSEDVIPILKAGAVQFYILNNALTTLSFTNSNSPFTITNFYISTNVYVDASTNSITNFYGTLALKGGTTATYTYAIRLDCKIYAQSFSNFDSFCAAYSNAVTLTNVNAKVEYSKGGIVMNTIISNINISTGTAARLFTNSQNVYASDSNTTIVCSGTMNGTYYSVLIQNNFKLQSVTSVSNGLSVLSGDFAGYLNYNSLYFYHKVLYAGNPSKFEANLDSIQGYSYTNSVDLITGQ